MAHAHKPRQQRKEYVKRFEQRIGMTRELWRQLKKENKEKAHKIRMKLQV